MLERFYLIQNVLITLNFLTLCASVGNKKGSVLLMHGVTMKFMQYNFTTNWYSNFMTFHKQDNDSFMGNAMTALSLILVAARLPSCKDTSTTFSNNIISIHQREEKQNILSHYPNNKTSGVPRNFFSGGVQQIQLRTEDREDGDLAAVAPQSEVLEAAVIWYKKFHFIQ